MCKGASEEKKKQQKDTVSENEDEGVEIYEKPLGEDQRYYVKNVTVKDFLQRSHKQMTFPGKLFPSLSPKKESVEDILRKREAATRVELEEMVRKGGGHFFKEKKGSERITCRDVLGGYLSLPEDADVNSVCHECYTYCLMELVMIQVLWENERHTLGKKLTEETERKLRDSLLVIQAFIPALLSACVAAFIAFRYESTGMRQRINELQRAVQNP